jgi:hypothetical protein
MARMIDDVHAFKPDQKPDFYVTFGYTQARALTAVLEQAVKDGDLSHSGVVRAAGEVGRVSFEGLSPDYTYGPDGHRQPPRQSSLFAVDASAPFGLKVLARDYEAPAAADLTFGDAGSR